MTEYPGAPHGFLNDHDPAGIPAGVRIMTRVLGVRHDVEASADPRRRTLSFFGTHLGTGSAGRPD